jgi:multidrug transporter EmrE-like cation transporter
VYTGYLFIALTVLLTVYGQLVLKWQVSRVGPPPHGGSPMVGFLRHMLLNPWVISGLGAAFAASLSWMLALKRLPLSTAYPFTASSFLMIMLFAAVVLHEPVTAGKLAGTALIVVGIATMALTA